MLTNPAAGAPAPFCPDQRGGRRCVCHGTFVSMKNGSGWIRPMREIDHPSARWNQGDIYLSEKDVCPGVTLTPGESVVFYLYVDAKGLGAEYCTQTWRACAAMSATSNTKNIATPKTPPTTMAANLANFFQDFEDDDDEDSEEEEAVERKEIKLADMLMGPEAELPSVGSALHAEGTCKRCSFFPKGTCLNGTACEFCHYEHEKQPKRRNRKTKKHQQQHSAEMTPRKCEISKYLLSVSVGVSDVFAPARSGQSTPTTNVDEGNASVSDISSWCGTPEAIEREPMSPISAPPGLAPPGLAAPPSPVPQHLESLRKDLLRLM